MRTLLIYGASGYTGTLVAEHAAARGLQPILAGRTRDKVQPLAHRLGLETRVAAVDDKTALRTLLDGVDVVLNCAGPFSRTAQPMAAACLDTGTHYLDITGEIAVFEAMKALDNRAAAAGILIMSGVGFDVVPSDCLAAHLKRRLPDATDLDLTIVALSALSRGTAKTSVEMLGTGSKIRSNGAIVTVDAGADVKSVEVPGIGTRQAVGIPWGDISTAYTSTGIPNIRTYMSLPPSMVPMMKASNWFKGVWQSGPVQALLKRMIDLQPPGPDETMRSTGRSYLIGTATGPGGTVRTRLETPEGYRLTMLSAVLIAEKVLNGTAPLGYHTPSTAFGPDLILEIEGTARTDFDA